MKDLVKAFLFGAFMGTALWVAGTIGAQGAELFPNESGYSKFFCDSRNGTLEVRVTGGRIDCETDKYVWEVEYAHKWKEGIGQSTWYAVQKPQKIPGLLIIIEKESDLKYLDYIEKWCYTYGVYIHIETIGNTK